MIAPMLLIWVVAGAHAWIGTAVLMLRWDRFDWTYFAIAVPFAILGPVGFIFVLIELKRHPFK